MANTPDPVRALPLILSDGTSNVLSKPCLTALSAAKGQEADSDVHRSSTLGACRVLCVDDSPTFRAVLHFALAEYPDVEIVKITESPMETVSEAVHSAREGRPYDLVLLDIQMGPPDGVKVARILRKNSAYVSAPIFFLTSTAKAETLREAGELGTVIRKDYRSATNLLGEIASHLCTKEASMRLAAADAGARPLHGLVA